MCYSSSVICYPLSVIRQAMVVDELAVSRKQKHKQTT